MLELRDSISQAEFIEWSRYHAVLAQKRELANATGK